MNVASESNIVGDSQADSSSESGSEVVDDTDDDPTFDPDVAGPSSDNRPRHSVFPLPRPNLQQAFKSDASDEDENPPQVPRPRPVAGTARSVAGLGLGAIWLLVLGPEVAELLGLS